MEEDFYFSKKQFISGLMMPKSIGGLTMKRGDVSLAKINDVWEKYTESVPRGRKPLSNHDDLVWIGGGKDVEIEREQLSQEQIETLIIGMKNNH
ncbi:hypothetical protein KW850_07020 [Bacillus sp. sid0103]|uniref:hypothetical protein n=1 Tax=unclassified Bacillus (in: firmicutes) TaxID=185979 RepID=UPI0005532151|nr:MULTISPECIES: hypothetical protein [unclassified Bacillus (in: firmicutes)]MBV7505007.1 hypothetical protein [Bacillus sp. sid0103]